MLTREEWNDVEMASSYVHKYFVVKNYWESRLADGTFTEKELRDRLAKLEEAVKNGYFCNKADVDALKKVIEEFGKKSQ